MQQEQQEPSTVTTNEKQRQTKSARIRRLEKKKHQTSAEVIADKIYFEGLQQQEDYERRLVLAYRAKQRALASQASELAALYHQLRSVVWQVMSFADRSTADQAQVIVELMLLTEQLQHYLMRVLLLATNEEEETEEDNNIITTAKED